MKTYTVKSENYRRYYVTVCDTCGAEIHVRSDALKIRNFCSNRCHGIWKTKNDTVERVCVVCGSKFFVGRKRAALRPNKTCSYDCRGALMRSDKSYGLKKVRSFNGEFRRMKPLVHLRDKNCQLCGSEEMLCVHHIDRDPENNDLWNLILLCKTCHGSVHVFNYECWENVLKFKVFLQSCNLVFTYGGKTHLWVIMDAELKKFLIDVLVERMKERKIDATEFFKIVLAESGEKAIEMLS